MKSAPPDETSSKNRTRGIKASPTKLRAARLAAGFKSQAEIVDRIQQQESLDKPPRSLVSRVFRGEAVDIYSIERVAKALDTEAWCLYLDSQESAPELSSEKGYEEAGLLSQTAEVPNDSQPRGGRKNTKATWFLVPSAAVLVVALFWIVLASFPDKEELQDIPELVSGLSFNNKVSVVMPINGPRGDEITQALQQALSGSSQTAAEGAFLYSGVSDPLDLIRQRKADLVLSGNTQQIGRHIAVQLFIAEHSTMKQIWVGSFSASVAQSYLRKKMQSWFATLSSGEPLPDYPDWPILSRFLEGKRYMHQDRSSDIVLRALTEFQSVVRLAPTFSEGHAGLCGALAEYSTLTGDKSRLAEAEIHCEKASTLNPDSIEALGALANLARKKGENDAAVAGFEHILQLDPNNVTAMRTLAETLMRLYFKSRDKELVDRAKSLLNQAAEIEPDNWKIAFTLARVHYFSGNRALAIEKFSVAANIYPSYQTFSNLGTLEFCAGELEKAKSHYLQAMEFAPEESALISNIATLHHYLGEYEQALAIYKPQLEKLKIEGAEQLHQVWGNIADAYHMQGMNDQAAEAYHRALEALEYEMAKGEGNAQQKASRLAIYLILAELEPANSSPDLRASLREQVEQLSDATDPVSLYHLAVSWIYLDELDKARELRDKLGASCPGYAASPNLKILGV